jgi:hypothetical protein
MLGFCLMRPLSESTPPNSEHAEKAARIAAMLERWSREDISDEPDWEVDDPSRLSFSGQVEPGGPQQSS